MGAYRVYTLAWACAGAACLVASVPSLPKLPPDYLLFVALSVAGHLLFVLDLPGGLRLSLQVALAPVWLYGWQAGPPLFFLTLPLVLRNSASEPLRALLYFGNGSVWATLGGLLFTVLRPATSPQPSWSEVAAVLLSGTAFVVGNFLTAAVGRYLATGDRAVFARTNAAEAFVLVFAGYVPLAYLLTLAVQTGPAAAFLAVGVWLLTAVALRGVAHTRRANEKLQAALRELEQLSVTDPLTGLWNRRHFMQVLPKELERHARSGRPLSLLVVDLRSLKQVNDTYGHQAGDRALQQAAQVFRDRLRSSDLAFRIGGDEFALLLPDTDTSGAVTVAEAVVGRLGATPVESAPAARLDATVGVATFPRHARDLDGLVAAADRALYRARGRGARVAVADAD